MGENAGQGGSSHGGKEIIPLADFSQARRKPRKILPLAIAAFAGAFIGAVIGVKLL